MKQTFFSLLAFSMVSVACAVTPTVSAVSMSQSDTSRQVTIRYRITGAPGIVTVDIRTNNTSIGDANITYLHGDVNKLITDLDSEHTITWQADKSWPGHKITDGSVTCRVFAWVTNAPPDYMVVDLLTGTNIHYYTSAEALPDGGLTNFAYRTSRLVMRKISAAGIEWTMGAKGELTADAADETPHSVTLTNDYYIGIFELTQGQWASIKGNWPSAWSTPGYASGRPVEQVSYNQIRGSAAYYPAAPASDSFLGLLRAKTGLAFDLPGEAQWEYACRAGVDHGQGFWGDGSRILEKSEESDTNLDNLGRYKYNGGMLLQSGTTYTNPAPDCTAALATATVGSYRPNSWGLYDMHGNVWEWCLDIYTNDITSLNGAVNTDTASGANRLIRGGCWYSNALHCRSACRYNYGPSDLDYHLGFRPALALGQ